MTNSLVAGEALRFIVAGKAIFTLRSARTGTRYTYKVVVADERPGMAPAWFVSLLVGQDNTSDYQYIGLLTEQGFRTTRASTLRPDSKPVVAFSWTINHLRSATLPSTLEIYHEGRCGRCGRPLTVPESITSGYGPECIGKVA
jgi:hypothetical protein